METARRTLVKGITWQLLGLITVTLIAYAQNGDWRGGITLALSACMSGFIFFYIHERIWSRISWGKKNMAATKSSADQHPLEL